MSEHESFLLTDAERARFARWLERQAESEKELINQLQSLPHAEALVEHKKRELTAYLIVARIINSTESMSISPKETP